MSVRRDHTHAVYKPLNEAWDDVKNDMLPMLNTNSFSNSVTANSLSTGIYTVTSSGNLSGSSPYNTYDISSAIPPVAVKPKTHVEWLRLRVEETCKDGRKALEAA